MPLVLESAIAAPGVFCQSMFMVGALAPLKVVKMIQNPVRSTLMKEPPVWAFRSRIEDVQRQWNIA
jgi:hypothetical protein